MLWARKRRLGCNRTLSSFSINFPGVQMVYHELSLKFVLGFEDTEPEVLT